MNNPPLLRSAFDTDEIRDVINGEVTTGKFREFAIADTTTVEEVQRVTRRLS